MEATVMKQKPSSRRRRNSTKSILRLPDLEHAKAAVLNSLNSVDAKRGYRHAIDEFVDWYCSEPQTLCARVHRRAFPETQEFDSSLRGMQIAESGHLAAQIEQPLLDFGIF